MIRILLLLALLLPGAARAAEIRVLTAGAYKGVLLAMAPRFEASSGHKLIVENETAGGVARRVREHEEWDVVILPPAGVKALGALIKPDSVRPVAKVGIAVAVRAGAPKPNVSTPEGVRKAVLAAQAPAWIDPAAGGSSGIYMNSLWEKWGIAKQVVPKAVLVNGGLVADRLLDGKADLAFQQASELVGVPGVDVVGMLPRSIQNYTIYAGAVPATTKQASPAWRLLAYLAGPDAGPYLEKRGMVYP